MVIYILLKEKRNSPKKIGKKLLKCYLDQLNHPPKNGQKNGKFYFSLEKMHEIVEIVDTPSDVCLC